MIHSVRRPRRRVDINWVLRRPKGLSRPSKFHDSTILKAASTVKHNRDGHLFRRFNRNLLRETNKENDKNYLQQKPLILSLESQLRMPVSSFHQSSNAICDCFSFLSFFTKSWFNRLRRFSFWLNKHALASILLRKKKWKARILLQCLIWIKKTLDSAKREASQSLTNIFIGSFGWLPQLNGKIEDSVHAKHNRLVRLLSNNHNLKLSDLRINLNIFDIQAQNINKNKLVLQIGRRYFKIK